MSDPNWTPRKLPPFQESRTCKDEKHCTICRAKEAGRNWRTWKDKHFTMPENAPDFICPFGKDWIDPTKPPIETTKNEELKPKVGCSACSKRRELMQKQLAEKLKK